MRPPATPSDEQIEALHRDPVSGSIFFREDPERAGPGFEDLRSRPWTDFVPAETRKREQLRLVETGGTTGKPICVAFTLTDLHENFVTPFVRSLGESRPAFLGPWLYVGPSGPHAIGWGAEGCAQDLSGCGAYRVDLDPRWLRKLEPGMLRDRYVDHVVSQAAEILEKQPVAVAFSTPPLLSRIGMAMSAAQRAAISGIHWGGVPATAEEIAAIGEIYPRARVLAGFGNSLVGLFPETGTHEGLPVYGSVSGSHFFNVVNEEGAPVPDGEEGSLVVGRRDASLLLPGVVERDRVLFLKRAGGAAGFVALPPRAPERSPEAIY